MKIVRWILPVLLLTLVALVTPKAAFATTYQLIAPSGTLTRGQIVKFTINIDAEGATIDSTQKPVVGLTYQSQYLDFKGVTAGDAMKDVTSQADGSDKLLLTGTPPDAGFSGTGTFATVSFQIIAPGPGSATLCALYNPSPTPAPTTPPAAPVVPTALPVTGSVDGAHTGTVAGFILVATSLISYVVLNKTRYHHKKTKH